MSVIVAGLIVFNLLANYFPINSIQGVQAAGYSPQDLFALTNQARAENGLVQLHYSQALANAAAAKSQDMFTKDYWAHFGPNGETPWQFIKGAGYIYQYAGENLGRGYTTADSLQNAWMNSATHRANILKPEFRDVGISVVDGHLQGEDTTLVVVMFGALPGANDPPVSSSSSTAPPQTTAANTTQAQTQTQTVPASTASRTTATSTIARSTSTATATPVPEVPPQSPTISYPANGSSFNVKSITLKGTSSIASSVKIYTNDLEVGTAILESNGNWTFTIKDLQNGTFNYKAKSFGSTNLSSEYSNEVKFTIDQLAPSITIQDFKNVEPGIFDQQQTVNTKFILTLKITDNSDKIGTGVDYKVVDNSGNEVSGQVFDKSTMSVTFPVNLADSYDIKVSATDTSGNITNLTFTRTQLSDMIFAFLKTKVGDTTNAKVNQTPPTVQSSDLFGIITQNITRLKLEQKVNLIFAFAFLLLALIDFVILYKNKIPIARARSLLHIPILAVIIVYAILSGLGSII